jgi:hypothetical protein
MELIPMPSTSPSNADQVTTLPYLTQDPEPISYTGDLTEDVSFYSHSVVTYLSNLAYYIPLRPVHFIPKRNPEHLPLGSSPVPPYSAKAVAPLNPGPQPLSFPHTPHSSGRIAGRRTQTQAVH